MLLRCVMTSGRVREHIGAVTHGGHDRPVGRRQLCTESSRECPTEPGGRWQIEIRPRLPATEKLRRKGILVEHNCPFVKRVCESKRDEVAGDSAVDAELALPHCGPSPLGIACSFGQYVDSYRDRSGQHEPPARRTAPPASWPRSRQSSSPTCGCAWGVHQKADRFRLRDESICPRRSDLRNPWHIGFDEQDDVCVGVHLFGTSEMERMVRRHVEIARGALGNADRIPGAHVAQQVHHPTVGTSGGGNYDGQCGRGDSIGEHLNGVAVWTGPAGRATAPTIPLSPSIDSASTSLGKDR